MKAVIFGILALPLALIAAVGTVTAAGDIGKRLPLPGAVSGAWSTRSTSSPASSRLRPATRAGQKKNPTYQEVSAGGTGHAESVQIVYDPSKVTYGKLLDVYWHNIDPTVKDRQFCDGGHQYRQRHLLPHGGAARRPMQSKAELEKNKPFKEPVVTEIVPAGEFYPAEEYHQHYYKKNPIRYWYYRNGCGRDQRLKELWGKAAGGAE